MGITNNNISQYEKGLYVLEIKTAFKMKRALNKPLDWIYFGDEEIIPKSRTRDSG
ncbi:XRE family transcriptional regulator [Candidatus Liberibacter solanacearum]|uniref:XRE family transcriptional regulator n=1 Tax=Candidatus Liberibacter solanacearum TaxID=556287 RepID=A0A3R7QU48_9HYPH|nr:XRE family transcriptional regulator [Candidatus Liberibacter solanacearum]